MKKSKAPIIVIAVCAVVFAVAAVLIATGKIGGERRDPDKERFEKALAQKYGEDFVCLDFKGSGVFEEPIRLRGIWRPPVI